MPAAQVAAAKSATDAITTAVQSLIASVTAQLDPLLTKAFPTMASDTLTRSRLAVTLATAAVTLTALSAGYRLYSALFHLPPHLRSLPHASPWSTIRTLLRRTPALDQIESQLAAVRQDALRRGLLTDASQTPPVFAAWVLGRWAVVLANPDDAKAVLNKIEVFEKMDFLKMGLHTTRRFLGRNVAMVRTPEWRLQRKIINPAFRRGWSTALFAHPARDLVAQLDALVAKGQPADVSNWMQRVTLDALAVAAFGQHFGAVQHADKSDMLKTYDAVMKGMATPWLLLFGSWAAWMPSVRKVNQEIDRFNAYIYGIIDRKVAEIQAKQEGGQLEVDQEEESKMDLLELMIRAQMKDDGKFTKEELRSNVVTFFLAGHDTTANSLTFALYLLGLHQDKQDLARAEVLRIMGADAISAEAAAANDVPFPDNEQQSQMVYLTYIVKEVLRLYPSVLRIPLRDLQTEYTFTSTSPPVRVPINTMVIVHSYAIQRAHEYWGKDAGEFRPERWAKATTSNASTASPAAAEAAEEGGTATSGGVPIHPAAHNYTWIPFGGGARTCIGNAFSLVEQRVILAMLLLRYTWKVVGDENALKGKPKTAPGGGLLHAEGIMIAFSRRN